MFPYQVNDETALELFQQYHAEELYALIDRNRERLRRWLLWVDKRQSSADLEPVIREWAKTYAETGSFDAGIWHKGVLVGMFGMQINQRDKIVHLSYFLGKEAVGKGIVTDCVRSMVNFSFRTLGANKVEIQIARGNKKSRAIPERLGFIQERTVRDGQWLYDHYEDIIAYSLLRSEWEQITVKGDVLRDINTYS